MNEPRPTCIGVPVDHRFGQLPIARLRSDIPNRRGNHAQIIEEYAQLQERNLSVNEISFAKWLSLPETKGGVLIVLEKPAEHQKYFDDHATTVKECASLKTINDVCKQMVGLDLAQVSCFDAFPFQTTPWNKVSSNVQEKRIDEAYDVFLMMIKAKEPDVILCCYQSPHNIKYRDFQSRGVGTFENFQVELDGRTYLCVNGFHPSYAVNHVGTSSVLRTLLIAKISQAFCLVHGISLLDKLTADLSNRYSLDKQAYQDQKRRLGCNEHEHKVQIFGHNIFKLKVVFDELKTDKCINMKDEEMYHFLMETQLSTALQDCALLLECVAINCPTRIAISASKQWLESQGEQERELIYLGNETARLCKEFLSSFIGTLVAQHPFRGKIGFLPADSRQNMCHSYLRNYEANNNHQILCLCLMSLVLDLDSAHTYQGQDIFNTEPQKLHEAFRSAAQSFEDILWSLCNKQQWASHLLRTDISKKLASLTITGSKATEPIDLTGDSDSPSGPVYPYTTIPQLTLPRFIGPSHQMNIPSDGLPSTGWRTYQSSASVPNASQPDATRIRRDSPCRRSHHSGHTFRQCPENICFNCKKPGHWKIDCKIVSSGHSWR